MNHSLILYWVILGSLRVGANSIMIILILALTSPKHAFLFVSEFIEFGKLRVEFEGETFLTIFFQGIFTVCFVVVWKLYRKMREKNLANFSALREDV